MFARCQHSATISRYITKYLTTNAFYTIPLTLILSMTVLTSARNCCTAQAISQIVNHSLQKCQCQSLLESLASDKAMSTQNSFHTVNNKELKEFKNKLDELLASEIKVNDYSYLHTLYKSLLMTFIKHKLPNTMCEEMYNKSRLYFHLMKSNSESHINDTTLLERKATKECLQSNEGQEDRSKFECDSINTITNHKKESEHMYFTFAQYLTSQIDLNACKENEQSVCEVLELLNTSLRILLIDAAEDSHFDAHRFSSLLLIAQNLITLQNLTVQHQEETVSSHLQHYPSKSKEVKSTKKFAMLTWLIESSKTQPSHEQEEERKHDDNRKMQSNNTNADDVMLACVHKIFTNSQAPEQVRVKMLACYLAHKLAREQIKDSLFKEYVNANYKSYATQEYHKGCKKGSEKILLISEHHLSNDDYIMLVDHNNHFESTLKDNLRAAFPTSELVSELITNLERQEIHQEKAYEEERLRQEDAPSQISSIRIAKAMLSTLLYIPTQRAHSLPCSLPITEDGHASLVVIITELLISKLMHIKRQILMSGKRANGNSFDRNIATSDSVTLLTKQWEDASVQVVQWLRQVILCHYKFCLTFTHNEHSRRFRPKNMQYMEQALWKLILHAANDNLFVCEITATNESTPTPKEVQKNHLSLPTNSKDCTKRINAASVPYVVRELILPFYGPSQWRTNTVNEFVRLAFDWNLSKVMQQVFYKIYYRERTVMEQTLEQVLQKEHQQEEQEQNSSESYNSDINDQKKSDTEDDYFIIRNDANNSSSFNNTNNVNTSGISTDKRKSSIYQKKTNLCFTPSLTFDSCVLLLESCWNEANSSIVDKNATSSKDNMTKSNSSQTSNSTECADSQTIAHRNSIMCANVIRYTLLSLRLAKHNIEYGYSSAVNKNKSRMETFRVPSSSTLLANRTGAKNRMHTALLAETDHRTAVTKIADNDDDDDEVQTEQLQRIREQLEWMRCTAIPDTTQIFSRTQMSRDDAFDWTSLY